MFVISGVGFCENLRRRTNQRHPESIGPVHLSYAQEGEDMVLRRIFEDQPLGFYVDVGAHHPVRFSTTYFFYRRGCRGINIDATPGSMDAFRRLRPRDINLEVAI
jgi:hypothetical protein